MHPDRLIVAPSRTCFCSCEDCCRRKMHRPISSTPREYSHETLSIDHRLSCHDSWSHSRRMLRPNGDQPAGGGNGWQRPAGFRGRGSGRHTGTLRARWKNTRASDARAGPAAIAEIFPTRGRSTWMSSSYALAVAIFGGFAPFVSQWLIDTTGSKMAPTAIVMAAAAISFIIIAGLRETAHQPLR